MSSRAQGWLQGPTGQTVFVALLAGLAALITWAVWRAHRRRRAFAHKTYADPASPSPEVDSRIVVHAPDDPAERTGPDDDTCC